MVAAFHAPSQNVRTAAPVSLSLLTKLSVSSTLYNGQQYNEMCTAEAVLCAWS